MLEIIVAGVAAFLWVSLLFVPSVTEIIVLTQYKIDVNQWILLGSGCIQSAVAILGGFKFGVYLRAVYSYEDDDDFWQPLIYKFSSLVSGSYIMYAIIPWFATNVIASWVFSALVGLSWYIHMMAYMPILVYCPFIAVGYAYSKFKNTTEEEEEAV